MCGYRIKACRVWVYLCRFRCTDTGCLAVEVTVVSSDEVYCLLCSCSGQSNIAQRNSASAQQFEIFAKLLTFDVHMFISLYAILFVSGNLPICCAVYVAKCLCEAPTALIRFFCDEAGIAGQMFVRSVQGSGLAQPCEFHALPVPKR
jgi:hypothetical protein